MDEKLKKLFLKAKYGGEPNLEERTWGIIVKREKHRVILRSWIFSLTGIFSLVGFIPMLKILFNDLAKSGFYEYLSLIFSDSGSIIVYFKEFTFSLAESLPIMSIVFTLSLLFICLLSLRYLMKQVTKNQSMSSLILST